jgi:hypothetical protein
MIKIGNIVLLDIVCSKNEEQTRIIADKMRLFDAKRPMPDDAAPSYSARTETANLSRALQIKIRHREDLVAVKNLINHLGTNGNHSLELLLPENKKIILQGKYFIASRDILDLQGIVGGGGVAEKMV